MDRIKKIVARVFEEVAREELGLDLANDNPVRPSDAKPMNKLEVQAIAAMIAFKAYHLHISTDVVECALHTEFRDWESRSAHYEDVVRWLVDFSGLN